MSTWWPSKLVADDVPTAPVTQWSADELVREGKRLSAKGHLIVFLYPSQEWMAVQTQTPFLRYERMPKLGAAMPQCPLEPVADWP